MTPTEAAREWAKQNPNVTGLVEVLYLNPNGKGGRRGYSRKSTVCYVKEGKAAQTRGKRHTDPETGRRTHTFNGYCHVCRQIFLEPALRTGHLPDPEAGQVAPDDTPAPHVIGGVRNQWAWLNACPACFERAGLVDNARGTMGSSWTTPPVDWARLHPAYWVNGSYAPAPLAIIDLTK
ncbi:MAG: hypothetical protein KJ077_08325 [Anaerolineae bacterium]|nr:hypothetical protein [Anaerolineae bacterium]